VLRQPLPPYVLGAALLLAAASACSSSGSAAPAAQGSPAASVTSAPPGPADAIRIAGFSYAPSPLTVTPGATVTVSNADSAAHTLTSDTSGLFGGGNLEQGDTLTFKAPSRPGTYAFHCGYHPRMHGTLVVR
jgi:plastocyanin